MRQLLLNWGMEKPQTLATFVVGQNEELLQRLGALNDSVPVGLNERFVYLWGEAGAGKSHLLRALAVLPNARYIPPDAKSDDFLLTPGIAIYLLDDCDKLSEEKQIAAFSLFNQVRDGAAVLVASGALPPVALKVREDLRTRLGWGLIYQVHGLTDGEKIDALTQAANARGLSLSPGVLPYLITHFRRDMRSLSLMLDALDEYSLETQRPITLPLLRSLLRLDGEPKTQDKT
jgi:DnaA family protein